MGFDEAVFYGGGEEVIPGGVGLGEPAGGGVHDDLLFGVGFFAPGVETASWQPVLASRSMGQRAARVASTMAGATASESTLPFQLRRMSAAAWRRRSSLVGWGFGFLLLSA